MPHIHTGDGQFDFTVSGYLVFKDKTLLIKHKYLPIWTPPAGHIELNQTPIDALFMEIWEESGISKEHLTLIETTTDTKNFARGKATRLPLPFDLEYHTILDGHQHINLAYILKTDTDQVNPGSGESKDYKWFTTEELDTFTETNESILSSARYALEYVAHLQQTI